MIEILNKDLRTNNHVRIQYLQFKCTKCGKIWAIYLPDDDSFPESYLVCKDCAIEEISSMRK
jgi:DNA-directed RNA polymerase subunit RPC12/RpoP